MRQPRSGSGSTSAARHSPPGVTRGCCRSGPRRCNLLIGGHRCAWAQADRRGDPRLALAIKNQLANTAPVSTAIDPAATRWSKPAESSSRTASPAIPSTVRTSVTHRVPRRPRRVSGGVRPVMIDRGRRALRRRRSRPAVGFRRKHAQRPALGRELGSRRPRPRRGRGQHVEVGMSKTVIETLHRRHRVRPFRGGKRSRWCRSRSESEHGITHAGGSDCASLRVRMSAFSRSGPASGRPAAVARVWLRCLTIRAVAAARGSERC
jgi:hypothetical protein